MRIALVFIVSVAALLIGQCCAAAEISSPDYNKDVAPIFAKYCSGCHNDTDLEGELSLSSFAKLITTVALRNDRASINVINFFIAFLLWDATN